MMKPAAKFFTSLFLIVACIDAVAVLYGSTITHAAIKPLLMPALLLLLVFSHTAARAKKIIIIGLLFCFLGDVFLLFESNAPLFFMAGLGCFLITHICYIIYFLNIKSALPSLLQKQPWMAALVAGYCVSLVLFLNPYLANLKIPVTLYAVVICMMVLCSLHVFLKITKPANILFVAGALLFAASDSILAINKFYKPFAAANVLIILTYCTAQFCIVQGVIKNRIGTLPAT